MAQKETSVLTENRNPVVLSHHDLIIEIILHLKLNIKTKAKGELTQPPIQWVPGALSLGVKRPGREAVHSPPSSAEVNNLRGAIPPLHQYVFMAWCLVKHRDNFTVLLSLKLNIKTKAKGE
jgi:hypothetical protein